MINKAILLGRIGSKEFKPTKTGSPRCSLSIATHEQYLDTHGNKRQVTTWHTVHAFNKLAEIANSYAHTGDLIYIEGKISIRKKEEENKIFYSIVADKVQFIPTGKKDKNSQSEDHRFHEEFKENFYTHELSPMSSEESIPF